MQETAIIGWCVYLCALAALNYVTKMDKLAGILFALEFAAVAIISFVVAVNYYSFAAVISIICCAVWLIGIIVVLVMAWFKRPEPEPSGMFADSTFESGGESRARKFTDGCSARFKGSRSL